MPFHSSRHPDGEVRPYWNESAYYSLTPTEAAEVEVASDDLHALCLEAVEQVISQARYAELGLDPELAPYFEASWEDEPPSLYGRFDLRYDGSGPPLLLEYNADTPTMLLESALMQLQWAWQTHPETDQFNRLHNQLVAVWEHLATWLPDRRVTFAWTETEDSGEDLMTVAYLRDTAVQAGLSTAMVPVERLGWDAGARCFTDVTGERIGTLFKLYPWEWLLGEDGAPQLIQALDTTWFIEPLWKLVLSNKGILPLLWESFPGHPHLLQAYRDGPRDLSGWVRKPLLSREGANISVRLPDGEQQDMADQGYGDEGYIWQQLAPLPDLGGGHAVIGSWIVGQKACGIGVRESDGLVTDVHSRFVPHLIEPEPTEPQRT